MCVFSCSLDEDPLTWSIGCWWSCSHTSLASPSCPLLWTPAPLIFCQFFKNSLLILLSLTYQYHLNMNLPSSSCYDNFSDNLFLISLLSTPANALEICFLRTAFLLMEAPFKIAIYSTMLWFLIRLNPARRGLCLFSCLIYPAAYNM